MAGLGEVRDLVTRQAQGIESGDRLAVKVGDQVVLWKAQLASARRVGQERPFLDLENVQADVVRLQPLDGLQVALPALARLPGPAHDQVDGHAVENGRTGPR